MLAYLIICHLIGDFLLQNDWMQSKTRNSFVCWVHVTVYTLPFVALSLVAHVPPLMLGAIVGQHFFQDRYGLHLRWMKLFGQTPPERWPVGPLCMDQSMHLAFIALFCLIFELSL